MTAYVTPYFAADQTIWSSSPFTHLFTATSSFVYDTAWVTVDDIPSGEFVNLVSHGICNNRNVVSGVSTVDPVVCVPANVGTGTTMFFADTDNLLGCIDVSVPAPALGYASKLTWTDDIIFTGGAWLTPSVTSVMRPGVRAISASFPTTWELADTWTLTIVVENTIGPNDILNNMALEATANVVLTSQVFDGVTYPLIDNVQCNCAVNVSDQKTLTLQGTFNAPGPSSLIVYISNAESVTGGADEVLFASSFTVNAPPVTSNITCTPSIGAPPLNVLCFASGSNGVSLNPPTGYAWDFGDGATSALASPTHVFSAVGVYTVGVVMTFDAGPTVPTSRDVTVSFIPPLTIPRNHLLISTPMNVTAAGFSMNPSDPLGEFAYTILSSPTHGSLSKLGSDATYIPDNNYFGYDSFTFEITDGIDTSQTLTYNIIVLRDVSALERVAWVFADADDYYPWPANPDTSSSGSVKRAFAYEVVTRETFSTLETREPAQTMTVSGTLSTQAEYEAFEAWYAKGDPIFLIDDLQRVFKVFMTTFTPERAPSSINKPWRHKYNMDFLVLGEV